MVRFFIFITILTIAPFAAQAQDGGPNTSSETRIEVDEENHVIRFFIKGEEAARLSESGFEVRENFAYGGVIRDLGQNGFAQTPETTETDQEDADAP